MVKTSSEDANWKMWQGETKNSKESVKAWK